MRPTAFLIDRDGVLNHASGGAPLPEARDWLSELQRRRLPFLIATNHTRASPERVTEELRAEGFDVKPSQVHTPLSVLREMEQAGPLGRVFARGAPELLSLLRDQGYDLVQDARADTVLLGFDREMTYQALATAIEAVLDRGARLVALHCNRLFRGPDGRVEPGLGAWVRAIEFATGVEAQVIGKPSAGYYRAALAKLGTEAADTVMISDDPLGDLAGAKQLGIHTVFVLSGMYRDRSVLESPALTHPPDRVCDSLAGVPLPERAGAGSEGR